MHRLHLMIALPLMLATAAVAARERPVVIELFTSQSCSSCPPAEALLNEYATRPDLLPLGFHVTYWNHLGWKDGYSFEAGTKRQESYAASLGSGSPFTPQVVIDGRTSAIGSRRAEIDRAIAAARAKGDGASVALERDGGTLRVRVGEGRGSARIVLVGFDRQLTTTVARGENRGRTIVQSNVVRSIRTIGSWTGQALSLNEAAPVGQDAAILLQGPDGGIVGAARLGS